MLAIGTHSPPIPQDDPRLGSTQSLCCPSRAVLLLNGDGFRDAEERGAERSTTTFPNIRGSASPKGEARRRRRRQGRAKRTPRQGGLRVGVGGAVQSNRTTQPTQHPPPQTPAAAQTTRRHPPNTPAPPTPAAAQAARRHPPPTSPTGRRQREPEGRSPARSAGKAERSECRAREDYGWGWAGGVTKPNHATHPRTAPTTPAAAQPVRRNPVSRLFPRPGSSPSRRRAWPSANPRRCRVPAGPTPCGTRGRPFAHRREGGRESSSGVTRRARCRSPSPR